MTFADANHPEPMEHQHQVRKSRYSIKMIGICAAAFVLVIVATVFAYQNDLFGIFQNNTKKHSIVYVKENELKVRNLSIDQTFSLAESFRQDENYFRTRIYDSNNSHNNYNFSSIINSEIRQDDIGKNIYYLADIGNDGQGTLYYRDSTKESMETKEGNQKGIKIAADVFNFQVSKDGKFVVYLKQYSKEKGAGLYYNDFKEEVKLDEEVQRYTLTEDEKNIVYIQGNNDESGDLYVRSLSRDSQKELRMMSPIFI